MWNGIEETLAAIHRAGGDPNWDSCEAIRDARWLQFRGIEQGADPIQISVSQVGPLDELQEDASLSPRFVCMQRRRTKRVLSSKARELRLPATATEKRPQPP